MKENQEQVQNLNPSDTDAAPNWQKWLKRFGVAGFLFFFIKGLAWIGIFLFASKCALEQAG